MYIIKLFVQSNLESSMDVFVLAIYGIPKFIHEKGLVGITSVCDATYINAL